MANIFDEFEDATPAGPDEIQPLSNALIAQALDERGDQYELDDDGDIMAGYEPGVSVYFYSHGENNEVLQMRGSLEREFSLDDVPRLIAACNDWNRDRIWPKAYVETIDGDDGPVAYIVSEFAADMEYGISMHQLQQFILCFLATTTDHLTSYIAEIM